MCIILLRLASPNLARALEAWDHLQEMGLLRDGAMPRDPERYPTVELFWHLRQDD